MRDQTLSDLICNFKLNLSGLNVYTEAASGPYLAGPVLCALAGAERVTAQVADSSYGTASEIIQNTYTLAKTWNVLEKIKCVKSRSFEDLREADIITNSGHVRPIDADLISLLKPTAVVPLMWETWELRRGEFDLDACKKNQILTLGTNESSTFCDMGFFIGLAGLKMLLESGFDGRKILLIGSNNSPADSLYNYFRKINLDVVWINDHTLFEKDGSKNTELQNLLPSISHIIVAEHTFNHEIIGDNRILFPENLATINPNLKILVMCGNVNVDSCGFRSISVWPDVIRPFGYISYQLYNLGAFPVLYLYAAGLKVGEQMARERIMGLPCDVAARNVLRYGLACDYLGKDAWVT
jgi:hypothetical protein